MTPTKEQILKLRQDHKLHETVEDRLKDLFNKACPGSYTLKEGYGVTSGRTDTTTFLGKGRIIHVEIIASKSMVFRDVTNLHQSSADLSIVVLLDVDYDAEVPKAFYSANAKNIFPTIWLSEILNPSKEEFILGKLSELLSSLD